MAKRPKRTYNQQPGQWEVEKLWDSRDDQGRYWKDGIQVDSSGRPWQQIEDEMKEYYDAGGEQTSTPGTGVGGGPVPEVGDETIEMDDPRNLTTVGSSIMPWSEAQQLKAGGTMGQEGHDIAGSMRRIIEDKTKGATSTRNIAPSLLNRKASANA